MQNSVLEKTESRMPVTDGRAGKYLAFHLGPEQFAIGVLDVREIMGMQNVTAVPQTPAYVKGIINLRGKVVPVIDLRVKFGMTATDHTARTCIIVVNVPDGQDGLLMGVIVDAVSEVANIAAEEIENPPDFGQGTTPQFLTGIAKTKAGVKMLLNTEKVLTTSEIDGLGKLLA
jgi:purine-binding chemotaxis protein CheW